MKDILNKLDLTEDTYRRLENSELIKATFSQEEQILCIEMSVTELLPFSSFQELNQKLTLNTKSEIDFTINTDLKWNLNFMDLDMYINHIIQEHNLLEFKKATFQINGHLTILCVDDAHEETILEKLDLFEELLLKYGINIKVDTHIHKDALESITLKADPKETSAPLKVEREYKKDTPRRSFKRKVSNNNGIYHPKQISELVDDIHGISIKGQIFSIETRETRNGSIQFKYFVHDGISAVMISGFANDESELLKKGTFIKAYGNYVFEERFTRGYVFNLDKYDLIEDFLVREDKAEEKRIEFHLHTNNSEMDGVSNANDYLEQAFKWGMDGLVITDHSVVQSFPKAYNKLKQLRKAYDNPDFKLGYGIEMNVVNEHLNIVKYGKDEKLHNGNYVVFDIETTGLSAYYDHIIEFGAVKIEDGVTVSSMQTFIKSPVPISAFTTELTSITQQDLVNAPEIREAMESILEYIGDYPLVAHNASFDYDFIQETLRRLNMQPIHNAIIDTLDLSRSLYTSRRSYRLGSIARLLKINYDENVAHRADYDAEVLCLVFLEMLRQPALGMFSTINDLQKLSDEKAFAKSRRQHLNVIAKNKAGLKRLYELVSLSHTKYLAFMSKSGGGEFLAEPRIIHAELEKGRENLLIGAGCTESEIFEIASNKSQQALDEAIQFYDYVEILPLDLYYPLVYRNSIPSEDRVKDIVSRIIKTADKFSIPVIAVGDVHYNQPYEKVARDVYINAQGIGGTRHPLYIFNADKRLGFVAPDQHFSSTQEMLERFSYLGEDAYTYVIQNPKSLFAQIDNISPKQEDLFTPKLENSDEMLKDIVYTNCYKKYGNPLPTYIQERVDRELKSILGHGYGVIYYISHLLVKKSLDDGYLVGSRGSVGSSFVATMAEITEVNPLAPHYVCPKCKHSEFFMKGEVASGYDLPPKDCPHCGSAMVADGQDIPFETFLGFEGDKVPDIDLNFSGEYQEVAHNYTKEIFGEEYVYRAGTISTVAQKTAYGYVLGYLEGQNKSKDNSAFNTFLAEMAEGVKRTSGQHPGGIIVIPNYMDVHDFTPIQYPANNPESPWYTTHYEFHDIDDNVLKLDILGHVDPTAMKFLEKTTGIDVKTIPMNDAIAASLFNSSKALKVDERYHKDVTGAAGLPEFGTRFVRQMLEATRPNKFSDLVVISGLSHGTGVWLGNAETLVNNGLTLTEVIGCRDDIMVYLVQHGLESKEAFDIMESVRKGKGLTKEWEESMKAHNVPTWYIDSCHKIKYMFPKAHAVAYVMMALRIAWFKVNHPLAYYASYFTLRCNAYEIETMVKDRNVILNRLNSIQERMRNYETKKDVTVKEKGLIDTLEITLEMINRGYRINSIDLDLSLATEFRLDPTDESAIIPPFSVVDGLGANVAAQIVKARANQAFISKKDLMTRGGISNTTLKKLDELGVTDKLQESNQMSLF